MEKVLLLSPRQARHEEKVVPDRVYVGQEFCERLLPGDRDVEQVIADRSLPSKRSLVTPFVTDRGLARVVSLVARYVDEQAAFDEVVINDWGVYRALRGYGGKRVLGRLLARQLRDPRLIGAGSGPAEAADLSVNDEFIRYICDELGIDRLELDTMPGELPALGGKIRVSLYRPYTYITTTRLCPVANIGSKAEGVSAVAVDCRCECVDQAYRLENDLMGRPLYLYGNTIYFLNEDREEPLLPDVVDRLVIQQLP